MCVGLTVERLKKLQAESGDIVRNVDKVVSGWKSGNDRDLKAFIFLRNQETKFNIDADVKL